mgnify:CR=1 FL=1
MRPVTLREWERRAITSDPTSTTVTELEADRLIALAIAAEQKLGSGSGEGASVLSRTHRVIAARQVVGVLAVPGLTVEILPKIDLDDDDARVSLVQMLAQAWDLPVADGEVSAFSHQEKTLLEILIRIFCERLFRAVHRGLSRRYLDHEEDLGFLRGQLVVQRQFTTLAVTPNRLACRFSELSSDIALNRILKAAVVMLAGMTRSSRNRRLLMELEMAFVDVKLVPVSQLAWDRVILDRTDARFRDLLVLARRLLDRQFQTTTLGTATGNALLFEMNTLFEAFIGRRMQAAMRSTGVQVRLQGPRRFVLRDEADKPRFATKPDIVLTGPAGTHVIDTKWKRLHSADVDAKRGVSQADVYQMLAYGQVYRAKRLTLLYPHHGGLGSLAGVLARYNGPAGCVLEVATIDVARIGSVADQCRRLGQQAEVQAHLALS